MTDHDNPATPASGWHFYHYDIEFTNGGISYSPGFLDAIAASEKRDASPPSEDDETL